MSVKPNNDLPKLPGVNYPVRVRIIVAGQKLLMIEWE